MEELMKGENKHKMCATIVKNYKEKERGGGGRKIITVYFLKYEGSDFILKQSTRANALYSSFIK
jgi:hypothetical protein